MRRWKDNIKINHDLWYEGVDGIQWLCVFALAGSFEHGSEPLGSVKSGKFLNQRRQNEGHENLDRVVPSEDLPEAC